MADDLRERTPGARVAVLGAYGAVGRRLLADATRLGHIVTAVGRDEERLRAVAGQPLHGQRLRVAGVDDAGRMRQIARAHDVVVNVTGRESVELAALVTDAGACFVDISAEPVYLDALAAMPAPRRPVLGGTGLAPGLTNILAAAVRGTGPIGIGIIAGVAEDHGAAARDWIWRWAGRRVPGDGTAIVYRTAQEFHVPGVGVRRLLRAAFGEERQLARSEGRAVTSWLGLDPPFATSFLSAAALFPCAVPFLDRLGGPLARVLPSRNRWTVAIQDGQRTAAWATGHSQSAATAIMTALSIGPVLSAQPGVWAAHELIKVADIQPALDAAGITIGMR
jgi:hypothetical protein